MCSRFCNQQKTIMQKNLMFKQTLKIPAGSPADVGIPFVFAHTKEKGYKAVAMGLVEIKNPNNKHFNIGVSVVLGTPTLDSVSKNFYQATFNSPVNDRFLPMVFDIPDDYQSGILVTPTEASGADDIFYQLVFKYEATN